MPIRPDQRSRYPANWREISAAIRARAGGRCERCQVPDRAWGWRDADGAFHEVDASSADRRPPWALRLQDGTYVRVIEIVLTVAHLDHQPENNDPENLRAWCQRCHLGHDRSYHQAVAAGRRHQAMATAELPLELAQAGD